MDETNKTRPTVAAYKAALLDASASGRFPSVVEHRGGGRCRYRASPTLACAIGIMLPEQVAKELDSSKDTAINHEAVWSIVAPYLPEELNQETAKDIQDAHDSLAGVGVEWDHSTFTRSINKIFRPYEK